MNKAETIIELNKLISPEGFKEEILYSGEIWRSDPELYDWIFSKMNFCTNQLINSIQKGASKQEQKRILKSNLRSFKRIDFDSEDAEFITECFELLAHITSIKFGDNLMRWLYGSVLWLLMKTVRFFKPERTVEKKESLCTNCNARFTIELKKTGSGSPKEWVIGKSLTCQEYNLIETFDNATKITFTNFFPNEHLSKEEFDEEKAEIRLEQIKYFRK